MSMAQESTGNAPSALAPPAMPAAPAEDVERGRCVPRVRAIGRLGVAFNWTQVVGRFLSILLELGALAFVSWLYSHWRSEPITRVDVLMPSFFPLTFGIVADAYEIGSLLLLKRKRAINPLAIAFDIVLIGAGIFCFLILGMVDEGTGDLRARWAADMTNAMIFMIVFCIIHASFIILAAAGMINIYHSMSRSRKDTQLARSQAEMVQFNERRARMAHRPVIA
ncbi:uncharacterized protein B0H64DRAFT_381599 [Chaetomium fimeti]|uniref:Uncharacterized protein n=1 Tax=Chaetomium fimeti TaxID=1854472 RepID=A0AAE0HRY2_9PEZI|nr:hypothetical protein B0H64DRAFT_381599 [Chaetomium fimeti]